jgi:hypothetical protein
MQNRETLGYKGEELTREGCSIGVRWCLTLPVIRGRRWEGDKNHILAVFLSR